MQLGANLQIRETIKDSVIGLSDSQLQLGVSTPTGLFHPDRVFSTPKGLHLSAQGCCTTPPTMLQTTPFRA